MLFWCISWYLIIFMIDVDYKVSTRQIIAMSSLNPSHISYPWMCSFCVLLFAPSCHTPPNSIHAIRFCDVKITTKSDVVGCHIGQRPSSTDKNRSTILFDCCVKAILPLMSSMVSFTAKMVVLRRYVRYQLSDKQCSHVGSINPPLPNSITNPVYRRHWTGCLLLFCPRHWK